MFSTPSLLFVERLLLPVHLGFGADLALPQCEGDGLQALPSQAAVVRQSDVPGHGELVPRKLEKHPLAGDGKYGSRVKGSIALQSCGLQFVHPDTGRIMNFTLPLPDTAPWNLFAE